MLSATALARPGRRWQRHSWAMLQRERMWKNIRQTLATDRREYACVTTTNPLPWAQTHDPDCHDLPPTRASPTPPPRRAPPYSIHHDLCVHDLATTRRLPRRLGHNVPPPLSQTVLHARGSQFATFGNARPVPARHSPWLCPTATRGRHTVLPFPQRTLPSRDQDRRGRP